VAVEVGLRFGRVMWEIVDFVGPEAWGMRLGEGGGSIFAHSAFCAGVTEFEELLAGVEDGKGVVLDCWFETASLRRGWRADPDDDVDD